MKTFGRLCLGLVVALGAASTCSVASAQGTIDNGSRANSIIDALGDQWTDLVASGAVPFRPAGLTAEQVAVLMSALESQAENISAPGPHETFEDDIERFAELLERQRNLTPVQVLARANAISPDVEWVVQEAFAGRLPEDEGTAARGVLGEETPDPTAEERDVADEIRRNLQLLKAAQNSAYTSCTGTCGP